MDEEETVNGDHEVEFLPLANEDSSNDNVIRNDCVKLFSVKDFVLEPQVSNTLMAFLHACGTMDTAIDCLSKNYQGLGAYANLLGCWLADLELGAMSRPTTSSSFIAEAEKKIGSVQAVADCYESAMSNLIKKTFNPDCADKIFEGDDESSIISWLPELISHKPWRILIYDLADQYPNCLMLSFAVKLISNAGFQHEICNVNTAVQQHLLVEYEKGGENTASFKVAFDAVLRCSCHSDLTFMYTQAILRSASKSVDSKKLVAICDTLAQSIRLALMKQSQSVDATFMNIMMIQSDEPDQIPYNTSQALISMISKNETNPADISQLYLAYSAPNPPPIELISDPLFMHMLIDSVFNATMPKVQDDHCPKYTFLLAYASCVYEHRDDETSKKVQSKTDLDVTKAQIDRLCQIVHSSDEMIVFFNELMELIKTPIVAACTLYYIKTFITKKQDFITEPSSLHFVLIDQIALLHPNLHARVFNALSELYDFQSGLNELAQVIIQRQRSILDRFVNLLYCGYVQPVIEKISGMFSAGTIDSSLVRYFGIEILELIEAPFSTKFVEWFLPILKDQEVFDAKTLEKNPSVKEFIEINKST